MPRLRDPVEILARLDWTEFEELEFKSAKGGLPKSLWETYSAMANTHGGVILLGVENDGKLTGVADPERLKKSFWDTINNRGKVSANLLTDADMATLSHGGATILAIRIPQAARRQRPVFLGQNPLTGTFRRNYEGDYHCTEQEVGRMLSDRSEEPADSRILEHFTLDDLDAASLQQYRNRFASHHPTHPWLEEDDKGLLAKLGGWRRDRTNGIEGLTVAGLLMFGKDEAIREAVPQYHVDYREKLSPDPDIRWTDRLTIDGTWCANLYKFNLYGRETGAARSEVVEQLIRFETELYHDHKLSPTILAATLIMSNKLIDKERIAELWEEIKMLDVLEVAREKGMEEGKDLGLREGKTENAREMLLEALFERFNSTPSTRIMERVKQIQDPNTLKFLFRQVFRCENMEGFDAVLSRLET